MQLTHQDVRDYMKKIAGELARRPIPRWWVGTDEADAEAKIGAALSLLWRAPDAIGDVVQADTDETGGNLQDEAVLDFIQSFEDAGGMWPEHWEDDQREYWTAADWATYGR